MMPVLRTRARERLARWARLALYVWALSAVSAWWLVREASAELAEQTLTLGEGLGKLADLVDGTTVLDLNGERVSLTSASTDQTVSDVLDSFTARCSASSGGMSEEFARLIARKAPVPDAIQPSNIGVLRSQQEDQKGTAACFARAGQSTIHQLLERAKQAIDTGELGAFGQLRVVFARRDPRIPNTHVVAVTAEGKIPLERMFPQTGDAPGSDLFPGVRPKHSRRVISAKLAGNKHQAAIYEIERDPRAALGDMDAELEARGFTIAELAESMSEGAVPTRVYFKEDDMVLVLGDDHDDRKTIAVYRLSHGGFVKTQLPI